MFNLYIFMFILFYYTLSWFTFFNSEQEIDYSSAAFEDKEMVNTDMSDIISESLENELLNQDPFTVDSSVEQSTEELLNEFPGYPSGE